jgi:hypothetical protein
VGAPRCAPAVTALCLHLDSETDPSPR